MSTEIASCLTTLRDVLAEIEDWTKPVGISYASEIAHLIYPEGKKKTEWHYLFRALQGDLNAITALIEREMPNARRTISSAPNYSYGMVLTSIALGHREFTAERGDRHEALALLAALLKALIATTTKEPADP